MPREPRLRVRRRVQLKSRGFVSRGLWGRVQVPIPGLFLRLLGLRRRVVFPRLCLLLCGCGQVTAALFLCL